MRMRTSLSWCCLLARLALAQEPPEVTYPELPARAAKVPGFVPTGWAIERRLDADFNGDARPDAVLVLRMKDPANVLKGFDTNPRMIVAVLAEAKDFKRVAAEHALIPRRESPTLEDPFTALASSKGGFTLKLQLLANEGPGWLAHATFRFRYEGGCFRLVGLETDTLHRASREGETVKVNFFTGQVVLATRANDKATPVVVKKKRSPNPPVCLEQVGDGFGFSPF